MYIKETKPHQKMINICVYVPIIYTHKMCKFLLMQVKPSLCKIELYNDHGTEYPRYPKDVLYLQPVQTYKAQTQC